jgi:L-aminoadipate-semialdehyde dehydrogenase
MNVDDSVPKQSEFFYSSDRKKLSEELPAKFETTGASSNPKTIFITGGTGFLGSHIIHQLVQDKTRFGRIIVHARASSTEAGLERVRNTCKAYGLEYDDRVECVVGDLAKPRLGIEKTEWANLTGDVDVIIHNGARVHWVLDYSSLRASNVVSTVELLKLCSVGKPKEMVFVSSTSVLDTDHYLQAKNKTPLPESDELVGSEQGLHTGYGQSKW